VLTCGWQSNPLFSTQLEVPKSSLNVPESMPASRRLSNPAPPVAGLKADRRLPRRAFPSARQAVAATTAGGGRRDGPPGERAARSALCHPTHAAHRPAQLRHGRAGCASASPMKNDAASADRHGVNHGCGRLPPRAHPHPRTGGRGDGPRAASGEPVVRRWKGHGPGRCAYVNAPCPSRCSA
jgi:hypothetical protein